MAIFEVVDTGIGISQEDIAKVFEPFERGGNPDAQRQKGVGLGLAITQALVRILGGDLTVTSEASEGTCFTVRLMLGQVVAPPQDVEEVDRVSGYEGARRKVLVIDDDPAQIGMVRSLLEPLDFIVLHAPNGAQGHALALAERPDIVLLDISMPGESGWNVCRRLREDLGPGVKIVMVSANAHEFSKGGDGQASHDMFLKKPVELDAMLDVVAEQLSIHWIGEKTEASRTPIPGLAPLPPAAAALITEIEQKAVIGHVRGIEAAIRALETALPEAAPLAAQLLEHLDRFDLQLLLKTVRAHKS
jgi:CheY-like chemotaxis protein